MKNSFILFFLVSLSACQASMPCPNEVWITQAPEQAPSIQLSYQQSQADLSQTIERLFTTDICWQEKNVGLQINGRSLKTIFHKYCFDGSIRNTLSPSITILMNAEGETLVNNDVVPVDSIANWMKHHFPRKVNSDREEVLFIWAAAAPTVGIEKVFEQVTQGYLATYRKMAAAQFGKKLCQLNQTERVQLLQNLSFRIKLGFGSYVPPPPPPTED